MQTFTLTASGMISVYDSMKCLESCITPSATVLNAVCCIVLYSLWKKRTSEFVIVGIAVTVLIWLGAELLNNYFVRRKK